MLSCTGVLRNMEVRVEASGRTSVSPELSIIGPLVATIALIDVMTPKARQVVA